MRRLVVLAWLLGRPLLSMLCDWADFCEGRVYSVDVRAEAAAINLVIWWLVARWLAQVMGR